MLELKLLLHIFLLQWLAFLPAWYFRTERFYDLVGGITYLSVVLLALYATPSPDTRSMILAALVAVWSIRLSVFLFIRVSAAKGDSRFTDIKVSASRFFRAWTLQGIWVSITASAALFAITAQQSTAMGVFAYIGLAVWLLGMTIEVVADQQKSRFKRDPANANTFIQTGLWSRCRHPNYAGEIILWTGIALIAFPALEGWRLIGLLSPAFVYVLLVYGSGIPLLEKAAENKWGDQPEYQAYKARSGRLLPKW